METRENDGGKENGEATWLLVRSWMDICANFLVFLLGCLVLQCLNHILMTDSLLHMKRSALSCHEKKTWKNKTHPESTRPTGPISSCTLETVYSIQYHDIHTVYIAYTWYHNPYTTCTQNVHSLNGSLQFINTSGTRAASVGSWPGTARTAFHSEKLVKIACKEVVNPHKTDHLQSPPTRFWTLPTKKKIHWYCWRFKNPAVAIAPAKSGGHYLHSFIHPRWSRKSSINSIKYYEPYCQTG